MSSDIELIVQRDLNRLPVLPEERWIPRESSRSALGSLAVRGLGLAAAVALIVVLSPAIAYVRDQVVGSTAVSARPTASPTAVSSTVGVSRQSVLARVRGLTAVVARAQRFEAKLVSSADLRSVNLSAPVGSLFWLVAVSGDVNCDCVLPPTQPLRSALFWFDAFSGSVLASSRGPATWPDGFDGLPDRSRSSQSRTVEGWVIGVSGSIVEFQVVNSRDRLRLTADENTAYSWTAGLAGGSALTIEELPQRLDLLAGATIDSATQPDGTYRLETLRVGIATK